MSKSAPRFSHAWTAGDREPDIGLTLSDGEAVSDYTITLQLARPDGTLEAIPATDLGGSQAKFPWAADSLIAGMNQRLRILVVRNADSETRTYDDVFIDVREALA